MASIGYIYIPVDVLIELVKYLSFNTLKAFRIVAVTNTILERELYPSIAKEMKKRGVLFNVTESKLSNLTSPIMLLDRNTFDIGIGIEIPIEAYARTIVNEIVTAHSWKIREVNIFEDAPQFLMEIFPKLFFVEKLRVSGLHYSDVTTLCIIGLFNTNRYLTTIELQLVQFPYGIYFPKNFLPNVINLKLTLCQGPGAASLLEAVELTVQNLQILDCYSRFVIPSSISLPNIRELCIKTQQRIRSLEINLSRVGKSLEKLELKGGVVLTPGFVLDEFPNVKTLVLENANKSYGQELLDACAQSVTSIALVNMYIGHVNNRFPYLEYLKIEYCSGDLGELLQNSEQISTLEVRDFELHARLDRLMFNLKHAVINGKVIKIGKAPILKGGKDLTMQILSL